MTLKKWVTIPVQADKTIEVKLVCFLLNLRKLKLQEIKTESFSKRSIAFSSVESAYKQIRRIRNAKQE
jgi:hypothetical protein